MDDIYERFADEKYDDTSYDEYDMYAEETNEYYNNVICPQIQGGKL